MAAVSAHPVSTAAPEVEDGAGEAEPVAKVEGEQLQNANEEDQDNLLVDEKLLKEEQLARNETETTQKSKPTQTLTKERLAKLDVLLDKAQMYSLFLVEQVNSMQEQIEKAWFPLTAVWRGCVGTYTVAWHDRHELANIHASHVPSVD